MDWRPDEREREALGLYIKLKRSISSVERRIAQQKPLPERLTVSQFAVLEALFFHGDLQQSVIAQKILSSTANLTFVLDNLVKAGYVQRTSDDHDRRIKTISLTEAGKNMISKAFPAMARAITESVSVLEVEEMKRVSGLLKILGTGQRPEHK